MLPFKVENYIKTPIALAIIVVFLFGFLCTGMFSKTPMDMSTKNMGMVLGGYNKPCCTLGATRHFDSWKNILLAAPGKLRGDLALVALRLVLIFGYARVVLWSRKPQMDLAVGRLLLYVRKHSHFALFNHLKLAFARGILNPKTY